MKISYRSLDDFLKSTELNVDGCIHLGKDESFSVKGCEIEAAILFCDMSSFSSRTLDMTPVEVLIFVNHFFTWLSSKAEPGFGIVDKYIGDEVMIVFSKDFGSENPIRDALQTARDMCDFDVLNFNPHVGVAAGKVVVGYTGTPACYNCSVFGAPVVLAARCASHKLETEVPGATITFPANALDDQAVAEVFPSKHEHLVWEVAGPLDANLKNLPTTQLKVACNRRHFVASFTPEGQTKAHLETLRRASRYWPRKD